MNPPNKTLWWLWVIVAISGLVAVGAIINYGADRVERTAIQSEWDELADEQRAAFCWGRDGSEEFGGVGLDGVSREVLDEQCPAGESQEVTRQQPLSADFEEDLLAEMRSQPPITLEQLGVTPDEADLVCQLLTADQMAEIMETESGDYFLMPWNGVGYEPSSRMFHETAAIAFESFCTTDSSGFAWRDDL